MIEKLKNLADKYGLKDKKSIDDFVRVKIQLLVSFFTRQKNFQYDESNRKGFNNILGIISILSNNSAETKLNHLLALYGILPENSQFKNDTVDHVLNLLFSFNKEELTFLLKNHNDRLNETIEDFFSRNFGKEDELKTIELIAEVLNKVKNYELLNNQKIYRKLKTLALNNQQIRSNALFNLLFFHLYSNFEIQNFNGKVDLLKVYSFNGSNEEKFINSFRKNDIDALNSLNQSHFDENYGTSGTDRILKNGKLWVVYSSLQKLENGSQVTFDVMEQQLKIKLEDLEDVLFDGFSSDLFKLNIDYERSLVKVTYVKKLNYSHEQVDILKARVSALRQKISGFSKKIDSLIISE